MSTYVEADGSIKFMSKEDIKRAATNLEERGWLKKGKNGNLFWVDEDGDFIADTSAVDFEGKRILLDGSPSLNFGWALCWIFDNTETDPEATSVRMTCFDGDFKLSGYQPETQGLHALSDEEVIAAIGFDPEELDYDLLVQEVTDDNRKRHPEAAEDAARAWRMKV